MRILLTILLLFVLQNSFGQTTYYVANNGSDASDNYYSGGVFTYQPTHKYSTSGTFNPQVVLSPTDINHVSILWLNNGSYRTKITKVNGLTYLTGLTDLSLSYTSVDSTTYDYSYPSTLQHINLTSTGIYKFTPTHNLPAGLTTLNINGNNLTTTEVNNTLVWLDGLTFNAGAKSLNITQGGTAPPSGAGATAVTSLQSKGWTVYTD